MGIAYEDPMCFFFGHKSQVTFMPSCLASLASLTSSGRVLWHILELSCGMLMDNSNHNNEQLAKMGQIDGTLHILCLN